MAESMEPSREAVAKIEAWLRGEFPGAHVESQGNFDREVWLFRARDKKAPAPAYELEVSYTAFEDAPVETIVTDLKQKKAAQHLREEPGRRLLYGREGLLGYSPFDPRTRARRL